MFKQNKYMTGAGWVIALILTAALCMSAYFKFNPTPEILKDMTEKMGYHRETIYNLGFVEIACLVLYLIPQTSVLGAVLLTGYLGGATATHVRILDPVDKFSAPIIMGALVWLGLFLRDPRIRALLPFRSNPVASEMKL